MNSLISYPTLSITPNKIKVKLFYYMLIHKVIKRKNKFKKILRNHFKIKGAKGIGMVYKKQDLKNYLSYNFYKINKIRDNNQNKSLSNTKEITLKDDQYKINLILDNRFKKYSPKLNYINNIKNNNLIDVKSNSKENRKPSVRKFNENKINKQENTMNVNLNNKLYSTNNFNSGKK
jgi:hypothetical protein